MHTTRFLSVVSAIGLLAGYVPAMADEPLPAEFVDVPAAGTVVPGEYIVLLADDAADEEVDQVVRKHKLRGRAFFNKLKGFAGALSDEQVKKLKGDARVLLVEPDVVVQAFAQTLPTGINRIDAELSVTADIDGTDDRVNVDAAVIDTGVQKAHPDLNVFRQVNFSRERNVDDQNGHGTHVAGTIGAKDNAVGPVGVAPGARIWSVKVLNRQGSGFMSDIIAGIDYVTANAASIEVANMSLGCECTSAALNTALTRSVAAGVVYAVAAGNSARDSATFSPANHPDVIAVSAIADFNGLPGGGAPATCRSDVDDTFADFSNFGAAVDIAAPGVCIYSTWKGKNYATISGTSMASPHVAGAAALYLSTHAKPTDLAGATAVKAALIGDGTPQADPAGFTGDPDAFAEPLLDASGL